MPRLTTLPKRFLTSPGLTHAADAAGYAFAGFQESGDLPERRRPGNRLLRAGMIFLPLFLALSALGIVALNI